MSLTDFSESFTEEEALAAHDSGLAHLLPDANPWKWLVNGHREGQHSDGQRHDCPVCSRSCCPVCGSAVDSDTPFFDGMVVMFCVNDECRWVDHADVTR